MDDSLEQAVLRAIVTMRDNLGEPLTVDDLARSALFSKFHFTRVFHRVTGVTPGRFLSAMRLQRAKHLLVTTELNVADISVNVGYNSAGTFSSRFSRSVGMSPTRYRRMAGHTTHIPSGAARPAQQPSHAAVQGNVWTDDGEPGLIFLGLFPERIPEGRPVRCTVLSGPGDFELEAVPPGTWYLMAQSVPLDPELCNDPSAVSVGTVGPIAVRRNSEIKTDLALSPVRDLDPPVLLALLDVRKQALSTVAEQYVGKDSGPYSEVA